jgi:multicomponent Na+:H+ antiporter subunit D
MFLIAGLIGQLRGSMDMKKNGGLYAEYPKLSLLIAIVLFSLVGIPPLSGFWPKIFLFQEAFTQAQYVFIGALIVGSFVTLYVIAKMWAEVFWKNVPDDVIIENKFEPLPLVRKILLVLPIGMLGLATLYIGLNSEIVIQLVDKITDQLINTQPYIEAVLGKGN